MLYASSPVKRGPSGFFMARLFSRKTEEEEPGGSLYVYDTCVVVDCAQWLDSMAACAKARFPDADIRVQQSSSSITGFCIVLRLAPAPEVLPSLREDEVLYCADSDNGSRAAHPLLAALSRVWRRLPSAAQKHAQHLLGLLVLLSILHCTRMAVQATMSTAAGGMG